MSLAVAQKSNLEGFVKPGELVEIRPAADLSLQDRRIFNLLIENAWSQIGEDKKHSIAIAKLRGPRHKGKERVADSVDTLMKTLVEVPTVLNGTLLSRKKMQLLGPTTQVIDEDNPKAILIYSFPEELRQIIKNSEYWGRIRAWVMFSFTSKYALTLYEAICLRANLRKSEEIFTVENFRAVLGVEVTKYDLFKNLKLRVIDPAVSEVNRLSDFNVEIDPVRDGGLVRGKLTGFRLSWERKPAEEWHEVLDILVGRKPGRRRIRSTAAP